LEEKMTGIWDAGIEEMEAADARAEYWEMMGDAREFGPEVEAEPEGEDEPENEDGNMSDVEADADTFASAGWGTDEDYGDYGGDPYDC
jgi:hypothetical protein